MKGTEARAPEKVGASGPRARKRKGLRHRLGRAYSKCAASALNFFIGKLKHTVKRVRKASSEKGGNA